MPKSAIDVAALLLLVFPGFLAYRFALARRADPVQRSPLWQLAEILEYSVYVHVLGIILVFGVLFALQRFGLETHISDLPDKGPINFLSGYFAEGVLLFTLYPVYIVFAATLMGAYDLPRWVTKLIFRRATNLTGWISARRFLGWVPTPQPPYPAEPIWYNAFHVATDGYQKAYPWLLVKMKQGDIYFGELVSYPVLPDSQKEKDFLIRKTRYYPKGDLDKEYRLDERDRVGAVLLNTAEVDSIQVYYDWIHKQTDR